MKIESLVRITSPETVFELYPDGPECAALFCGGRKVVGIGRIVLGSFDEAAGLPEKLRRHLAGDRLSASAEGVTVIPFGCEYHVERQWKFAGDAAEFIDDIRADNGGSIGELMLETIRFPGEVASVSIRVDGEAGVRRSADRGVVYDGRALPMLVQVEFADGVRAEFYSGDDFWRHNCSSQFDNSANHIIRRDDEGVIWQRMILRMKEVPASAVRRPWRFRAMVSASRPWRAAEILSGAEYFSSGCFAAPAQHREFRSFVRRVPAGEDAVLAASGEMCCFDGSHISRPGKQVQHGMLGELFGEYIWASGVLAKEGGRFAVRLQAEPFADSVIAGNLGRPAPLLTSSGKEDGA